MPGQPTNTTPMMNTLKMITQSEFTLLSHKLNSLNGITRIEDTNMNVNSSPRFPQFLSGLLTLRSVQPMLNEIRSSLWKCVCEREERRGGERRGGRRRGRTGTRISSL